MRISVVHPHKVTAQLLCTALAHRLNAAAVDFSSIEDVLSSSMNYDVFILYNIFGRTKMDRWVGVKWIRVQKPEALVISVIHRRFFDRKDAPPGADAVLFFAGDTIDGLVKVIQKGYQGKSIILTI